MQVSQNEFKIISCLNLRLPNRDADRVADIDVRANQNIDERQRFRPPVNTLSAGATKSAEYATTIAGAFQITSSKEGSAGRKLG